MSIALLAEIVDTESSFRYGMVAGSQRNSPAGFRPSELSQNRKKGSLSTTCYTEPIVPFSPCCMSLNDSTGTSLILNLYSTSYTEFLTRSEWITCAVQDEGRKCGFDRDRLTQESDRAVQCFSGVVVFTL